MKKYDMAVFIGRFQPVHVGHLSVINQALTLAKKVLVIVGSAGAPRTTRNPFTDAERIKMIEYATAYNPAINFATIEDIKYNDERWIQSIQETVAKAFEEHFGPWHPLANVCLIGHKKDNTSFYLNLFPQWASESVPSYEGLSSTNIRDYYFDMQSVQMTSVPQTVRDFMLDFKQTVSYQDLVAEKLFVTKYKESWATAPFPPTFVATDAVVIQSGHILLVERKHIPGKGLLALPGGFLGQEETIIQGTIRELREETKLKVPEPVLKGSIVKTKVFDDPHRSERGRMITHATLFHLKPQNDLPKVKGGDDAKSAMWHPLSEIKRINMFNDHYDIIQNMIGDL